jgi:hypothetical protein
MLDDDLRAFVVLELFVLIPELFPEGYVFIADRDREPVRTELEVPVRLFFRPRLFLEGYVFIADRDCAELVVLIFFWIEPVLLWLDVPVLERLDIRVFPVGLTRFFPVDDRTDFPDA